MSRAQLISQNQIKSLLPGGVTLALLVLAVSSAVLGLAALLPYPSDDFLLGISILGVIFAWMIGTTRINGPVSSLVILLTGLAFLITLSLNFNFSFPEIDLAGVTESALTLKSDLISWAQSIHRGAFSPNQRISALVWGLVIWLSSGWGGWFQRRWRNPLIGILPVSILLVIALGYTYARPIALFPLIFFTLMLIGFNHFTNREQSWHKANMDYPDHQRGETSFSVFGIIVSFVLLAAILPAFSPGRWIGWLEERYQHWSNPAADQIAPIFESLGLDPGDTALDSLGLTIAPILPRSHLIGAGPDLLREPVMTVSLISSQGIKPGQLDIPLYWRGAAYDLYTGSGWTTSEIIVQEYAESESAMLQTVETSFLINQEIEFFTAPDRIYAAGDIITVNAPYRIARRILPDGQSGPESPADFFLGTQSIRKIQVLSQLSAASADDLVSSSTNYPDWITDRYLQLPDSVASRVTTLAHDLTARAPTPYTKAVALEEFLRTYPYELNLPAPPQNREISDYFLFELQKGYCDYYATSMVVLARSIGLPARFVTGYTQGTYNPKSDVFRVTGENAHSWVEIYFTGIGWIPFEPTASLPALNRSVAPAKPSDGVQGSVVEFKYRHEMLALLGTILTITPKAALLIILLITGSAMIEIIIITWIPIEKSAPYLFRHLYHHGYQLGTDHHKHNTPHEFTAALQSRIRTLISGSRWENYFSSFFDDLSTLTEQYVQSLYRHNRPTQDIRIPGIWVRIRIRLILARMLNAIPDRLMQHSPWKK